MHVAPRNVSLKRPKLGHLGCRFEVQQMQRLPHRQVRARRGDFWDTRRICGAAASLGRRS